MVEESSIAEVASKLDVHRNAVARRLRGSNVDVSGLASEERRLTDERRLAPEERTSGWDGKDVARRVRRAGFKIGERFIEWPSDEELARRVRMTSETATARSLGVSWEMLDRRLKERGIDAPYQQPTKIVWPSDEELCGMIEAASVPAVSRKLGVSDNAIRKRLRVRGLAVVRGRRS